MKVTFSGRYRIHEFAAAIDRVSQNLLVNGVDELQSVSLYFGIFREGQIIELTDEDGEKIEHLRLDGPRRRQFEPLTEDIHVTPPTDAYRAKSNR